MENPCSTHSDLSNIFTVSASASQSFKEEIDGLQEELNVVQNLGAELMTACGEPDKPVIKKSIDEVMVLDYASL